MPSLQQNTKKQLTFADMSHVTFQADMQIKKQFMNVINAQAALIDKLIINQQHLVDCIKSCTHSKFMDESNELSENDYKKNSSNKKLRTKSLRRSFLKKQKTTHQINRVQQFQSDVNQSQQISSEVLQKFSLHKISETKNVIKNFSKALFKFIQKHRVFVEKVLEMQGKTQELFQSIFQKFKGKIYTINDLKLLWLQSGNQCHKVFRIISMEYVRKYHLHHIFYSRIVNFKVHVKYRNRIYEILNNPSKFTSLKMN